MGVNPQYILEEDHKYDDSKQQKRHKRHDQQPSQLSMNQSIKGSAKKEQQKLKL